jgi:hypothetical protein
VLRPLAAGQVQFNYFTVTPNNGSPGTLTGDATQLLNENVFPGTYEISFYPTRDIPKNGYIEITFPTTEFNKYNPYTI